MGKVKRALISVSNKTGIVEFAKALSERGIEILSTGGTAKELKENGIPVRDVSEYTGFPEILDGRVKTLHPKIHGGILGIRSNPEHVRVMNEHGIEPIDLVAINLYPFQQTILRPNCTLEEAIENIDIGGPAMLRAAAKNYESVTVVIDPGDYKSVLEEIQIKGEVSRETNLRLAIKVFETTATYDRLIAEYLKNHCH